MNIKRVFTILLSFAIIIALTGCSVLDMMAGIKNDEKDKAFDYFAIIEDDTDGTADGDAVETIATNDNKNKKDIIAYYKDVNGFVIPVNTDIEIEEGIAKAVIRQMIVGSDKEKQLTKMDLHGTIPEGTEIIGMSIKDGLCVVDFTKNILNTASYEDEEDMVTAISYALTEFDTINKVEIRVEGKILNTLSNGYPIHSAFERENINLVGSADGANYTVYFKTAETEIEGHYVPLTFSADKVGNPVKIVLEKLFNGVPEGIPVGNNIPYGISFNDVNVTGGVAKIDLSVDALKLKQDEYEELKKIVVLCLQQFKEISDYDFSIEGITFEEAGLIFTDPEVTAVFNSFK